jgi:hypothetical protein
MHTAEEEYYVFLRFADGNISHALMALDHIQKTDIEFVRLSLLKDAAISYCRPFKQSCGSFNKNLKPLDNSFVPSTLIKIHKELLDLRDQVFAHTDLDVRSAVLHCWTSDPSPIFPIQFKGYDYPQLLSRTEEIRSLFNNVLTNIRDRESAMEAQFANTLTNAASINKQSETTT